VAMVVGLELSQVYPLVAWLCWVPNLAVAQLLIVRSGAHRPPPRGDGSPPVLTTRIRA
jgi:hypothetical protein